LLNEGLFRIINARCKLEFVSREVGSRGIREKFGKEEEKLHED